MQVHPGWLLALMSTGMEQLSWERFRNASEQDVMMTLSTERQFHGGNCPRSIKLKSHIFASITV